MYGNDVRVVIACVTYNHEKLIETALKSFITQKLSEPFHVYIHDDCSTDRTPYIIKEYQRRYPDIIKPTFQNKNLYSQGISISRDVLFPSINAQYVALCEGDDFFVNESKLQKQVDFLDANPDYSICFHQTLNVFNHDASNIKLFPGLKFVENKKTFTKDDLLHANFIQTSSCMYRWRFNHIDTPQKLIPENILPCDYFWHLLHAECGKIGYIDGNMSVYNIHSTGLWSSENRDDQWIIKHSLELINFSIALEKRYFVNKYESKLKTSIKYLIALANCNKIDEIIKFYHNYKELYEKSEEFFISNKNENMNMIGQILTLYKTFLSHEKN